MSVAETGPPPAPPAPSDLEPVVSLTAQCPYIASSDRAWRSSSPTREHRCGAVTPPAPLAFEKQRRLCLAPEYATCVTYLAAKAARDASLERVSSLPRPVARMTPVILDRGRVGISIPTLRTDRTTGQTILIAALGIAFAAIVIAKLSGAGEPAHPGAADTTASPFATATASAFATPSPTLAPTSSATPVASVVPSPSAPAPSDGVAVTAGPSVAPSAPAATRTYKVQSGDTLSGIANRFGTTTKALIALNGLTDPSHLKVGQVLRIP